VRRPWHSSRASCPLPSYGKSFSNLGGSYLLGQIW
jgi:hypothetical protein